MAQGTCITKKTESRYRGKGGKFTLFMSPSSPYLTLEDPSKAGKRLLRKWKICALKTRGHRWKKEETSNWSDIFTPDSGKDERQEEKGTTSPTQQTWVWVSSGSWWWTGKPCMLQSMGHESRVRHDWVTELNWSEIWHNYLYIELGKAKLHLLDSNWELI